ncbi:extracellular solute-binding protein [Ferrimicrobium sp.]|jgi:putative spermidine/putrescine transport system substrate-binding protein|uniref:Extracellular solute-binding protein n=1 Tax=Ferrimicrobium acidiphilum TaxID=121039 RepID=A0ABV3Y5V8_9ACTN|nr:extracellular solute-binding protein [Ferrimicrobium sp.]MCL5973511.1 ABC transporter substrate-binding protein [Actinomycetota bacterium]
MMVRAVKIGVAMVGCAAVLLSACSSSSAANSVSKSSIDYATCTSLAACGGMTNLVKAAKSEGSLTVTALPADWANYGQIMTDFEQKYHIKITDVSPDASSATEIDGLATLKGSSRSADVVDVGIPFAVQGARRGLFADYRVKYWSQIPSDCKAPTGQWFCDYGGYISIGYDAGLTKSPVTGFASLSNPAFHGGVALDGNPEDAGAAFSAVIAAALGNGGSYSNVMPGIRYFEHLKSVGNFIPVQSSPATIASGEVKVNIDWDYLNVAYENALRGKINWKVIIPKGVHYASYYAQAIAKDAPHPAAARLWEEYLYSNTGQNLWLKGYTDPIRLASMIKDGTVNRTYLAAVPTVTGTPVFPSQAQLNAAQTVILANWPKV